MNKTLLVAFAFGAALLTSCSSNPSDLQADKKVSVDQVPPGTRDTDIYNLNGGEDTGHGANDGHGHDSPAQNNERKDVMPNHDEHNSDIGGNDQVPAHEKTTNSENVENHQ